MGWGCAPVRNSTGPVTARARAATARRGCGGGVAGLGLVEKGPGGAPAGVAHAVEDGRIVEAIVHVTEGGLLALVQAEHVAAHRQVHPGAEGAAAAGDDHRA